MERMTPTRSGDAIAPPIAAATKVEVGNIAVANATGFAAHGSAALNLTALGIFTETKDNTTGADGDLKAEVLRGVAKLANSAGDAVDQTSLGKTVYVEDPITVSKTDGAGAQSAAGKCIEIDDDGVWVDFR